MKDGPKILGDELKSMENHILALNMTSYYPVNSWEPVEWRPAEWQCLQLSPGVYLALQGTK